MTNDRPRACTEPPWQYILDRKELARQVPRVVMMQLAGKRDAGIAKCPSCGREFVQTGSETVCPTCRKTYIDPVKDRPGKPKKE